MARLAGTSVRKQFPAPATAAPVTPAPATPAPVTDYEPMGILARAKTSRTMGSKCSRGWVG